MGKITNMMKPQEPSKMSAAASKLFNSGAGMCFGFQTSQSGCGSGFSFAATDGLLGTTLDPEDTGLPVSVELYFLSIAFSDKRDLEIEMMFNFWDGRKELLDCLDLKGKAFFGPNDAKGKTTIRILDDGTLESNTGRDNNLIWRDAEHSNPKCRTRSTITAVQDFFKGKVQTSNGCEFENPAGLDSYPRAQGVFYLMLRAAPAVKPSTFGLPETLDTKMGLRLNLVASLLIDIKTGDTREGVNKALAPLRGGKMSGQGGFMLQVTGFVSATFFLMTGNSALDQQLYLSIPLGCAGFRVAGGYGQDDQGYEVEDGLFLVGRAKLSLIDVVKPLGHKFFYFGGKRSIFDLSVHIALGVFIKKTGMGFSLDCKWPLVFFPQILVQVGLTLFGYWSGPNQGGLFQVPFRVELAIGGEHAGIGIKLGVKWGKGNKGVWAGEEADLQTSTRETAEGAIPFTCDIQFKELITALTKWVGSIGRRIKDWVKSIFKGEEQLQMKPGPVDKEAGKVVQSSNRRMLLQSEAASSSSDFLDALAARGTSQESQEQNLVVRSHGALSAASALSASVSASASVTSSRRRRRRRRRRWHRPHRWHAHHPHRHHIHHPHRHHIHHPHRHHVHVPHRHHVHVPHIHLKLSDIGSVHFKIKNVKMNLRFDGFELSFHASLGCKIFGIGKSGSFNVNLKFSLSGIADAIWNAIKSGLNGIKKIFSGEELSEDYEEFLQSPAPISVPIE